MDVQGNWRGRRNSIAAASIMNGAPGGGFGFFTSGYTTPVGITGDGTYLYVPDPFNNRINRFWLQAGSGHVAGGFKDMLNTGFYSPLPSSQTGRARQALGDHGGRAAKTEQVDSVHVDKNNIYYTASGYSAVVKRNLSDGSFVGWSGDVSGLPTSCTGTGDDTVITPGWCYGGSPKTGTIFGMFNYGNQYISGDANYVYISDNATHRVTRLPKAP